MYIQVETMENEQKPESGTENNPAICVKVPRKVLHFSDGILEEFSDDEVDSDNAPQKQENAVIDPKTLTWGPWFAHKAWSAGTIALAACDYAGESLASFFGITTPKYYFELEEYKKREAERKALEEERKGWSEPANVSEQDEQTVEESVRSKQPLKTEMSAV